MVKFKSILAAAVVAIGLAFHPGAASATPDGNTRWIWFGTDGSVSLWLLDPSLNYLGSHGYGPYGGWTPITLDVNNSTNNAYVLWRYTDGTANIWALDANLNFIKSNTFGPVSGWIPVGLGFDPSGNVRLYWRTTANQVTVWVINPSALTMTGSSPVYGPYFGYVF
ncbi:MAG: hypothetical protein JOY83_18720 [Alphaproteobacteria bacterium]|nr:hypothetical protein [Alphaproteobacteria bacterium]